MAKYSRSPVYTFLSVNDIGINKVPKGSLIDIYDDANNVKRTLFKMSNNGLSDSSTISDFINNQSLYKVISSIEEAASDNEIYVRRNGAWEMLDGGSF
jgi:hypothetical protein